MEINLNTVLEGVILALILAMFNILFSVREHLAKLNGRIGKAELAMELKIKVDDERHTACVTTSRDLWEAVRK